MVFIEQFHYHINRRHCRCLRCSSSRPLSRTFCCCHSFLHKVSSKTNKFSTILYFIVTANLGGTPTTSILLRSRICRLETLVNFTSRTHGIGRGTHALSEGQILQFSTSLQDITTEIIFGHHRYYSIRYVRSHTRPAIFLLFYDFPSATLFFLFLFLKCFGY